MWEVRHRLLTPATTHKGGATRPGQVLECAPRLRFVVASTPHCDKSRRFVSLMVLRSRPSHSGTGIHSHAFR